MQPFCNKGNQILASDQVAKATNFALSTNFLFVMQPPKKKERKKTRTMECEQLNQSKLIQGSSPEYKLLRGKSFCEINRGE